MRNYSFFQLLFIDLVLIPQYAKISRNLGKDFDWLGWRDSGSHATWRAAAVENSKGAHTPLVSFLAPLL